MSAKPITRNYGCKGTTIFADMQILWVKSNVLPSVWVRYPFGVPILIYRLSTVYVPFIYRISTIVNSGGMTGRKRQFRRRHEVPTGRRKAATG